jgi:hypothetical protein
LAGGTLRDGRTIVEKRKYEQKRRLGYSRHRLVEDINMHFKGTAHKDISWTHLAQDKPSSGVF